MLFSGGSTRETCALEDGIRKRNRRRTAKVKVHSSLKTEDKNNEHADANERKQEEINMCVDSFNSLI